MKRSIILSAAAFAVAGVFVAGSALAEASRGAAKSQGAKKSGPAHWTYSGTGGPKNWGKLTSDYTVCGKGHRQSPINVTNAVRIAMAQIVVDYKPTPLAILNNGHTIQVNYAPGSIMRAGNRTYRLLQFHFHAPSEHKVNGQKYDAEVHFVHKADDGALAVLGVLIRTGAENPFVKQIWAQMPSSKGSRSDATVILDPNSFLPQNRTYMRYFGSLTTPPCSEGVNWFLLTTPVEMSRVQIESFRRIVGPNNRPVQKLHERYVLRGE